MAGLRIDPPWSPPKEMSTSPAASAAPDPDDEPPVTCSGSWGLIGGGKSPTKPIMACLPTTLPPAARTRVTTVASTSGTKPSRAADVKTCGIPATLMWSLNETVLPASSPLADPPMSHFHSHAR